MRVEFIVNSSIDIIIWRNVLSLVNMVTLYAQAIMYWQYKLSYEHT